jgi:SAM-dependent methyltransferase
MKRSPRPRTGDRGARRGSSSGRRALSTTGGPATTRGDAAAARILAECVAVRPGAGTERLTHGFHTWPARLHPDTARRAVARLSVPGERVLDPFCGGGTVLVEALVGGRAALGRDLNPLAVRLARLRGRRTSQTERRALRELSARVASFAARRADEGHWPRPLGGPLLAAGPPGGEQPPARHGAAPPFAPWEGPDAALFAPRVLRELAWLTAETSALGDPFVREALALVLSSLLVKLSARASETDRSEARDRRAPARAAALFRARADELERRLGALSAALPPRGGPRDVLDLAVDDARQLGTVPDDTVDLVVTSPPYAGVYDYAEHHDLRLRWLGLDDRALVAGEVGARRSFADAPSGLARWEADGRAWVAAVARALRPGGRAAVMGGDGASPLGPIRFDESFGAWAAAARLRVRAAAAQHRPALDPETRRAYPRDDRREHLILVEKP